ncbi:unnamed protein product, partial [Polarella glacialis]
DKRADDLEFAVAWESDGSKLTEVMRVPMSCPNIELVVPGKGPYVFEARLDSFGLLHPECGCVPKPNRPCPNGVRATSANARSGSAITRLFWSLVSPTQTHFVVLQNEWAESIPDYAVLGRLLQDLSANVTVVSERIIGLNASDALAVGPEFACAGTRDDRLGGEDVTLEQLRASGLKLPDGHVTDRWCLVKRGHCSETSKVKVLRDPTCCCCLFA